MNSKKEVQHVYLVGAKSLGAYGGYETFVYKLTEYHQNLCQHFTFCPEFFRLHDADGQIYAEKFTSACLICKVFYGKMKAQ